MEKLDHHLVELVLLHNGFDMLCGIVHIHFFHRHIAADCIVVNCNSCYRHCLFLTGDHKIVCNGKFFGDSRDFKLSCLIDGIMRHDHDQIDQDPACRKTSEYRYYSEQIELCLCCHITGDHQCSNQSKRDNSFQYQ